MNSIFGAVKDAVVDKMLDNDKDDKNRRDDRHDDRRGDDRYDDRRDDRRDDRYDDRYNDRRGDDDRFSRSGRPSSGRYSPPRDSGSYRATYDRDDAYDTRRRSPDRYANESQGYGGHGGRAGAARPENDRYDSGNRDYRRDDDRRGDGYPVHSRSDSQDEGSLFSKALSLLSGKEDQLRNERIDEQDMVNAHRDVYERPGKTSAKNSENGIAQAAAVQALKMLTGGGGSGKKEEQKVASQGDFVTLAMKEAVKLFDQEKKEGNLREDAKKDDVVTMAAKMALKLFLQSKTDQSSAGSGGGAGQLLSLASTFLK